MLSAEDTKKVGTITPEQARQMKPQLVDKDKVAYESIYSSCMARIKAVAERPAEHEGENEFCVFIVPPINFNLPSYDPDVMFERLYSDLNVLGYFLIAWRDQRKLFISWSNNMHTVEKQANMSSDN